MASRFIVAVGAGLLAAAAAATRPEWPRHMTRDRFEAVFGNDPQPRMGPGGTFAAATAAYHAELETSGQLGVWVVGYASAAAHRASEDCVASHLGAATRGRVLGEDGKVFRKHVARAATARAAAVECGVDEVHPVVPELKVRPGAASRKKAREARRSLTQRDGEQDAPVDENGGPSEVVEVEFAASAREAVVSAIEDWFASNMDDASRRSPWVSKVLDIGPRNLVVRTCPSSLVDDLATSVASIDGVVHVAVEPAPTLDSYNARWMVQSNDAATKATPLYDMGLSGEDVVVNVNDDGVDVFSCFFRDDAVPITEASLVDANISIDFAGGFPFPQGPHVYAFNSTVHRKVRYALWPFYDPVTDPSEWSFNPGAHGSHTAGTALGSSEGDFVLSFGNVSNYTADGVAPNAKMAFLDMSDVYTETLSTAVFPPADYDVIPLELTYGVGATVSSNSWGAASLSYDENTAQIDDFSFEHQDFLVVFSAGNSGHSDRTVGSPGLAKNTLQVGATEAYVLDGLDEAIAQPPRPTATASAAPTFAPTFAPTTTNPPSAAPSAAPSATPTTAAPWAAPTTTIAPSAAPSAAPTFGRSVNVFYDKTYVDTRREAKNVIDALDDALAVTTFTNGADPAAWIGSARTTGIMLPELEGGSFATTADVQVAVLSFVEEGGVFVSSNDFYSGNENVFNAIFGTALTTKLRTMSGPFSLTDGAWRDDPRLSSVFSTALPALLPSLHQVYGFENLSEDALSIYETWDGSSVMFALPVGLGYAFFVAFDWWESTRQEWDQVLTACFTIAAAGPRPTAMPTTTLQPTMSPAPSTSAPTARLIRVGQVVSATLSAPGEIIEFHVVGVDEAIDVTFSTCGSEVDADMHLWADGVRLVSSDRCFCCSDTADGWWQAAIDWTLSTGAEYTIQIEASGLFETGLIQLSAQKATPNKNTAYSYPNVARYSSRGPTADNRIKPDVVAPGGSFYVSRTSIYSAASPSSVATESCSIRPELGTSMSCPAVAGLVALLTEYFRKGYYPTGVAGENAPMVPMGAALKAVIIASGQYLTGSEANRHSNTFPNYDQGHGFPIMDSIFNPQTSLFVDGDFEAMTSANSTDDVYSYTFEIKDSATGDDELRVVLCWHDPAALPFTSGKMLINDLDLVVSGPDGTATYPNFGHVVGDHVNTVERIIVTGLVPGRNYTATVSVSTLAVGPQPFALVATGPFVNPIKVSPELPNTVTPTSLPTSFPTFSTSAPSVTTASPSYATATPTLTTPSPSA